MKKIDEIFVAETSLSNLNQIVYLDFDGADAVYSNDDLKITADVAVADSGFTVAQQQNIISSLNAAFGDAGIVFVNEKPADGAFSTVFVGSSDAFAGFKGISETIDAGNQIKNDNAFAFVSAADGEAAAVSVIAHEVGHLIGESHAVVSGTLSDYAAVVPVNETFTTFVENEKVFRFGSAGSVYLNNTFVGSLDAAKWELAGTGKFMSTAAPSALWIEKATGNVYVQENLNSIDDVKNKTNLMGVLGEGYSISDMGDFFGTGLDGVLLLGPSFGDASVSLNYGLPVWVKESDGSLTNGWLGALVNTWQTGDALKGDFQALTGADRLSVINANNYQYELKGAADFNGDGKDDVVLRNCMPKTVDGETITGAGDVFVFLTDTRENVIAGNRPADGIVYSGCATDGWDVVGFGDFDGDGTDDMLLSDGSSLAGWKMANGARVDNLWFGGIADGYELAGVADVNYDGCADIVFRYGETYQAWTVSGGVVTGGVTL